MINEYSTIGLSKSQSQLTDYPLTRMEETRMDTTEFSEGLFLTPQVVSASPTKIGVVLSEAIAEKGKYGNELCCNVMIDFKTKKWRLNIDSVKNMHRISRDSKFWVSCKVQFTVVTTNGREKVIGSPIFDQPPTVQPSVAQQMQGATINALA